MRTAAAATSSLLLLLALTPASNGVEAVSEVLRFLLVIFPATLLNASLFHYDPKATEMIR